MYKWWTNEDGYNLYPHGASPKLSFVTVFVVTDIKLLRSLGKIMLIIVII